MSQGPPPSNEERRTSQSEELVTVLQRNTVGITREWHGELTARLRVRPSNVFPGTDLLDGMPRVVEWIVGSLRDGNDPDGQNEEALREVATHWRRAGLTIEESLLHFRLLASILYGHLGAAVDASGPTVSAGEAVRVSARLCDAIDGVQVILVATYRDAEEGRIIDFAADMAHELRSHLGSAETALALLDEEDVPPAKRASLVPTARRSVRTATRLLESVQEAHGSPRAAESRGHQRPLLDIAVELAREVEANTGREVGIRIDDDLPTTLVPEGPVSLILHNLLENGVKYADPEKGERWVRLQCRQEDDGHLVVQVGDNGLGVSEEEQKRIFTRFRRGARAPGVGYGLGLSIAQEAARRIGSRLMLESRPGHGSTFGFTIPLKMQGEGPHGFD